jgi:ferredoxin
MPEKYHIKTKPIPPRRPRIGKYGIVDWREDCARCHNCVKKACVYDRHRQEAEYIRNLSDVDVLFFDCMGCLYCVQNCTKGLLNLSINPEFENLGNDYWTPDIIQTTWNQAETAKIPVSGAGYRGKFSGPGFDSMWTDMSEIVRPTRDGIHGREYISTSVDIGRKLPFLSFQEKNLINSNPPLLDIPMPIILDMPSEQYSLPELGLILRETAKRTGIVAIVDASQWSSLKDQKNLSHIAFHINPDSSMPPKEVMAKTKLVQITDGPKVLDKIKDIKKSFPNIIISVKISSDSNGTKRAIELASYPEIEVLHVAADMNGNEIGVPQPRFIKDMIREIHTALVDNGNRDEITLIASGGIALAEHLAKIIICGADLAVINLPLLIALECHLCKTCKPGHNCPAKLEKIDLDYGVGRMTNLVAAWHDQLIEVMGAMGMREARRLRGDVGRGMFFEQLEEETFGKLFGTRK